MTHEEWLNNLRKDGINVEEQFTPNPLEDTPTSFPTFDGALNADKIDPSYYINPSFHPVAKPAHYNQGGIECIEAIKASMSVEEFRGYTKGNVLKYVWRYGYKNGVEDLKKAQWYLQCLIETFEEQ